MKYEIVGQNGSQFLIHAGDDDFYTADLRTNHVVPIRSSLISLFPDVWDAPTGIPFPLTQLVDEWFAEIGPVTKGDYEGHPFHGNQWESVVAGPTLDSKEGYQRLQDGTLPPEQKIAEANSAKIFSDYADILPDPSIYFSADDPANGSAHQSHAEQIAVEAKVGIASSDLKSKVVSDLVNQMASNSDALRQYAYGKAMEIFRLNQEQDPTKQFSPKDILDEAEREKHIAVSMLVNSWAQSSNGHDLYYFSSLNIQRAVEETLGVTGAKEWEVEPDAQDILDKDWEKNAGLYKSFVSAVYENTQKFLADRGITHISASRGVILNEGQTTQHEGEQETQLRPLSSFSTSNRIASAFAELRHTENGDTAGSQQWVMSGIVPAKYVFSTPLTGIGCLQEQEVVLLGGNHQFHWENITPLEEGDYGDDDIYKGEHDGHPFRGNQYTTGEAGASNSTTGELVFAPEQDDDLPPWADDLPEYDDLPGTTKDNRQINNAIDDRFHEYLKTYGPELIPREERERQERNAKAGFPVRPEDVKAVCLKAGISRRIADAMPKELDGKLCDSFRSIFGGTQYTEVVGGTTREMTVPLRECVGEHDVWAKVSMKNYDFYTYLGSDKDPKTLAANTASAKDVLFKNENGITTITGPEMLKYVKNFWVSLMIGKWAESSSEGLATMHKAIQDEFGLTNVNERENDPLWIANHHANFIEDYKKYGDLLRAFVRAQYNDTQKLLKQKGITSLKVYRGMGWQEGFLAPKWVKDGLDNSDKGTPIPLNPASSFSTSKEVAESFGTPETGVEKSEWAVIGTEVPASQILSVPATGFGCYAEDEIVVLAQDPNSPKETTWKVLSGNVK